MAVHYLENRRRVRNAAANMMADVMRHLQARQHLGKAIIVCDQPAAMLPLAQKQWLKLSRTLQRRRAFSTNAVEILKYTYTITQMQHMNLAAEAPHDDPEATAFLVRPKQLGMIPANCFSLYLTSELSETAVGALVAELPPSSLLVDYTGQVAPGDFGLKPKTELEDRVAASWQSMEAFLAKHEVDMRRLARATVSPTQTEAMDDALDVLLGVDAEFLTLASSFQRTLDTARPLQGISKLQRDQYEALVLLAHRVQALSPGGFSAQFLRTYGDDAFFLHDMELSHESLAEAVARHQAAGRTRVARALLQFDSAATWQRQSGSRPMGAVV
ncbi:MAG: hypothetical protein JWN01_114 [Patescibacteria group bacterium]|nr:hypothetical protein [Patescibacteria group bacterium]